MLLNVTSLTKENEWLDSLNKERQVKLANTLLMDMTDTNTIYEFNGDFWHGNPDYIMELI
jgi:hypothetical protein